MRNMRNMKNVVIIACILLCGLLAVTCNPIVTVRTPTQAGVTLDWVWEITDDSNPNKFAPGISELYGYKEHTPQNGFPSIRYSQAFVLNEPYRQAERNTGWYKKELINYVDGNGRPGSVRAVVTEDARGYDTSKYWPHNKGQGDPIIMKVPTTERVEGPPGHGMVEAFHFWGTLMQKGSESEDAANWVPRVGVSNPTLNPLDENSSPNDYRRGAGWPVVTLYATPPGVDEDPEQKTRLTFMDGYGYTFWVKSTKPYTAYRTAVENSDYRPNEGHEPGFWYGTGPGRDANPTYNFQRAPVGEWTQVTVIYDPTHPNYNMDVNQWIYMYQIQQNYPGDTEPYIIKRSHDKDNSIRIAFAFQLQHNFGQEGTANIEYSVQVGRHDFDVYLYDLKILKYGDVIDIPPPIKSDFDNWLEDNPDATWNDWLEHNYQREFGYLPGVGELKAPIGHNLSAEEYFFAKGLNAGWNLGNTYELNSNPRAATGSYDKLMPGVKEAGFNVIRIPVTWGSNTTGGSPANPNSVVNTAFLDSVEDAVKAAHAAGLVVFINTHHDKGFFDLNRAGDSYNADGADGAEFISITEGFKAVWRQIAERFKDYGDWLIFESLNEPTISQGGSVSWDGAPVQYMRVLNEWNQAFVDTVRETGGNNEKRYLIFKSYAGKLQTSLSLANEFAVPTDPAGEGKLVFSFHSYVPQPLGLEGQDYVWTQDHVSQYNSMFYQARENYLLKGIPVFMGETGATFHSRRTGPDSVEANKNRLYLLNALGSKARQYGVIPVLWDNGEATRATGGTQPNGETFAMFRRKAAHDNDEENWGLPIDHTRLLPRDTATGGTPMLEENAAYNDPQFGEYTIKAFIDAVNGRRTLGNPEFTTYLRSQ